MTFDEATAVIQQTEQAMQTALEEERYEDAKQLGQRSVQLVKTLTTMVIPQERQQEFVEFARAYTEYARGLLESLSVEREKVRQELIGLNKGNRASRSYGLVRHLSRS